MSTTTEERPMRSAEERNREYREWLAAEVERIVSTSKVADTDTLRLLLPDNLTYNRLYIINDRDIEKVKRFKVVIEERTAAEAPVPTPGDSVLMEGPKKTYDTGRMEGGLWEGTMHLCTQPMVPFALNYDPNAVSMSGGYWKNVPIESLEYVGTAEVMFKVWGRGGAQGDGAIYFTAKVNQWRYRDETIY